MNLIKELKAGDNDVAIRGEVAEVSEPRTVTTRYGESTVADTVIKDATGEIKLTLWRDRIGLVKKGDKVEIRGAYVKEWQGRLELGVGKNGEIKVL